MEVADTTLDPAHVDTGGVENAGAAGIPSKDAAPDFKMTDDGNIVEHGGKKYITMDALTAERNEKQRLSETVRSLEPLMPEFKEFLEQKENRGRATVDRTAAPTGDYTEDELAGLAITRGYYKADGVTPDLARAAQELNILTRVADRRADRRVKPVEEMTTRERAKANREAAAGRQFVDGEPVADAKFVKMAMDALPDEYIADQNIASITHVIAAGLEYLDMRKNGQIRRGKGRDPMFVERGTGRFDGDDGSLSALDLAAARARGKTPEQWAKMQKQINPGRSAGRDPNILEEV